MYWRPCYLHHWCVWPHTKVRCVTWKHCLSLCWFARTDKIHLIHRTKPRHTSSPVQQSRLKTLNDTTTTVVPDLLVLDFGFSTCNSFLATTRGMVWASRKWERKGQTNHQSCRNIPDNFQRERNQNNCRRRDQGIDEVVTTEEK